MIIEFKKFGALKDAKIELAPLTLLVGANNTSKTYALYAIYGLMRSAGEEQFHNEALSQVASQEVIVVDLEEFFKTNKTKIQNTISSRFTRSLSDFFSTEQGMFKESALSLQVDLDALLESVKSMEIDRDIDLGSRLTLRLSKPSGSFSLTVNQQGNLQQDNLREKYVEAVLSQVFGNWFLRPWSKNGQLLLPAERGGLNLFYQELNFRRTALFHHATKPKLDMSELLKDVSVSRYPRPIADYIDLLNDLKNLKRRQSDFHDLALALQKEVLNGTYSMDNDGAISFKPYRVKQSLGLHLSSSTAKSYFGLWFYLEHMADPGDILMIDEPELNLHPDNQRRIARVLARMVKRGLRVVLSTHSDYLVREFNNLILLAHDFPERDDLRKRFGYSEDEFLDQSCVGAYCFSDNTIKKMEISPEEGIIAETFDKVINDLNDSSYELASAWAQFRADELEGNE